METRSDYFKVMSNDGSVIEVIRYYDVDPRMISMAPNIDKSCFDGVLALMAEHRIGSLKIDRLRISP